MTMAAAPIPHRLGSIGIPRRIATRTFTPGDPPIEVELRNLGYLDKIRVRLSGTVTVGAATPDERAGFPFDIVRAFRLQLPDMDDPYHQSGYGAKMQQRAGYMSTMARRGFDAIADTRAALANAFYDASIRDNFPIATGTANAWNITWEIDPRRSFRDHRGLLPMPSEAGDSVLVIEPAALADLFDAPAQVTATALTVSVTQVIRTPPVTGVAMPDTGWVTKYDMQTDRPTATGEYAVELDQEGIILNAISMVWLDDDLFPPAPEGSINDLTLEVNEDPRFQGLPTVDYLYEQGQRYLQPFPAGVFVFDFDHEQADVPYIGADGHERAPGWVALNRGYKAVITFDIASGATLDNARIVTSVKRLVRARRS